MYNKKYKTRAYNIKEKIKIKELNNKCFFVYLLIKFNLFPTENIMKKNSKEKEIEKRILKTYDLYFKYTYKIAPDITNHSINLNHSGTNLRKSSINLLENSSIFLIVEVILSFNFIVSFSSSL
ncbi:MAG: hypothetical protein Q7T54_00070 [Candidatus Levybacteria bacterium]|nr:hypothetical protein [Candidatus Levybacteria bacterium]